MAITHSWEGTSSRLGHPRSLDSTRRHQFDYYGALSGRGLRAVRVSDRDPVGRDESRQITAGSGVEGQGAPKGL